jgi:predicted metal-dependent phosphoesterase TrpH
VRTAFRDYIGLNAPAYAERRKMTSEQVIRNIRAAGGVPVLAHGGLLRIGEVQMNQWIDAMVRAGMMGLECYHNAHTPAMERFLRNAAAKRGLLVTGGSDFHGATRKDIDLGTGLSRWDDRQGCRGKLLSAIEQVRIQP